MYARLLVFSLLLFPTICSGQIDSTYVRKYEDQIAVKAYIAKNFVFVNQQLEDGTELSYLPNNPPTVGLGVSINNTIIDFSYGYGFDFMRDKEMGKTKALDFQLHHYAQKFVLDLFIQRYSGFYQDDNVDTENGILLCPDLSVQQYGLYGHYVFNNRKFSYRAAFVQNERQLRSAGSFLLGGGVYLTKIKSDGSFVYNGDNSFRNFQFGISAGYAYTWVWGSKWYLSASATTGINFGSERAKDFGKKKIEVYPTVFPRISVGYNRNSWSANLSYVGNVIFTAFTDNSSIGLNSGSVQLTLTKRMNFSFMEKEKERIPSVLRR